MNSNSEEILKKHEEENRRSAMAKRMAEEEKKRNDINVEHWNGIQSDKVYRINVGGARWSERGKGGKILFVLGVIAALAVVSVLVFTAIKSFQLPPVREYNYKSTLNYINRGYIIRI